MSPRSGKKSLSGFEMRTSWRPIFTVLVSPQDGEGRRPRRRRARRRARRRRPRPAARPRRHPPACADNVINEGALTVGTDNPAYPPWFGGGTKKGSTWKINDPSTGKGFESAVAYAVAKQLGFAPTKVTWVYVPFTEVVRARARSRSTSTSTRSRTRRRARRSSTSAVRTTTSTRRSSCSRERRSRACSSIGRPADVQARRAARHDELRLHRRSTSSRRSSPPCTSRTIAAVSGAEERSRSTASSSTCRRRSTSPRCRCRTRRSSASSRRPPGGEHFGMVFAKGNPLAACVNRALAVAAEERAARSASSRSGWRRRPAHRSSARAGAGRPPLADPRPRRRAPAASRSRSLSTVVVFGVLVARSSRTSPGWPEVKETFFDWDEFKASFPEIARAFKLNVKIFCIAEVFILVFALAARRAPQPARAGVLPAAA